MSAYKLYIFSIGVVTGITAVWIMITCDKGCQNEPKQKRKKKNS